MTVEKKRIRGAIQRFLTPRTRFVRKIINGHKLILDLEDTWIRNNFLWCDIYEPETTAYIEQNVIATDVVLDIGAHIGYHSLNFGRNGATVYAFEPDTKACRLYERNTGNVALRVIVSDHIGEVTFYESKGGSAWNSIIPIRNSTPRRMNSITIDALHMTGLDWAKIDVEGAELQVLQGMRKTIENSPDLRLIVEWLPKNDGDLEGILKFLDGWNCKPLDHNMLFWR